MVLMKPWVALIELLHLALRTPAKVAIPSVASIDASDGLESSGSVEVAGKLVGDGLDRNEILPSRGRDRALIEVLGV